MLVHPTSRQSRWCPEGYTTSHFLRPPHSKKISHETLQESLTRHSHPHPGSPFPFCWSHPLPHSLSHVLSSSQFLFLSDLFSSFLAEVVPLGEKKEIPNARDDWEGKPTVRFLHPSISGLVRHLNDKETRGQSHKNTTSYHHPRGGMDELSRRPLHHSRIAPKMGNKPPSSQSERPTTNRGLPRQKTEPRYHLPPQPKLH